MNRLLFLALLLPVLAWAQINKNGDFQIWTRAFFNKEFGKNWDFQCSGELRWGNDVSKLYFMYAQAQLLYSPTSWLILGPGYRQIGRRTPLSSHHWKPGYSPLADATFVIHINGWEIRDRNRLQYLILGKDPYHWLYRNRFRLISPKSFTRLHLTPFADNEIFWKEASGVNQNRTSFGLLMEFSDNSAGEIFYMLRFMKQPGWTYQNVMNVTLSFTF